MKKPSIVLIAFLTFLYAEKADVVEAKIKKSFGGSYVAYVHIKHKDVDEKHFVDHWQILNQNRKLIAPRVVFKPHPNEKIIYSDLYGFKIPKGTKKLIFRAHCSKDGYGGKEFVIDLTKEETREKKTKDSK
ncbi:hypothetical protein [Nitrosophilus labii]|uniref:hypothetical protein n=1 Tax=Nitrosophilus labii TaxID=2706014 RepID=UPI0016573857|nr:hypothetical protein [Nitrosophilus labii]